MLAGWLLSAWQVSLGFTLGLQYCYLLLVLALLTLVFWWRGRLTPGPAWQRQPARPEGESRPAAGTGEEVGVAPEAVPRQRGPLLPRHLLGVTLVGLAVLGAVAIYQARPYLKVAAEYPTAKRTLREVETYSAGPAALFAASSENRVWGSATAGVRAKVNSKNESVFFPGGLILVLAVIGLAAGGRTPGDCASDSRPAWWSSRSSRSASASPAPAIPTGCCTTTRRAGTACACRDGSSRSRRCSTRCSPARGHRCSSHDCARGRRASATAAPTPPPRCRRWSGQRC